MPAKITTADCKKALIAAWPETFGDKLTAEAGKWKRVKKYGKRGAPIDRIFHHDTLPLHALVVEEEGAITRTVIRGFGPFEVGEEGAAFEAQEKMAKRANSNAAFNFLKDHTCFRASDFTFSICTPEQAEESGEVWYELYPKCDFGRARSSSDAVQLDYLVDEFLPDGDGESMEGTFVTERSIEDAIRELRAKGFIPDSEFVETTRLKLADGDED
jgi:hypothetical protein